MRQSQMPMLSITLFVGNVFIIILIFMLCKATFFWLRFAIVSCVCVKTPCCKSNCFMNSLQQTSLTRASSKLDENEYMTNVCKQREKIGWRLRQKHSAELCSALLVSSFAPSSEYITISRNKNCLLMTSFMYM